MNNQGGADHPSPPGVADRFLAPPPPPPLPPPPPAHMQLFNSSDTHAESLVMIKSEPCDEGSLVVHNNNFATLNEYNDESNTSSSHEEILNSEFGQTVREIVPSGRTVLGTNFSTVFENHRKSLIQHCERSELRLHFEWTKVVHFGEFLKT